MAIVSGYSAFNDSGAEMQDRRKRIVETVKNPGPFAVTL